MPVKLPPNVYRYRGDGFRAVAKVGHVNADRREKTFPAGTTMRTIAAWQEATRADVREAKSYRKAHAEAEAGRPVTRAAMAEIVAALRTTADRIEAVIHAS